MLTLPIPAFCAIVLAVLCLNLVRREGRYGFLAALIALCAVQSAVIALAQHYGVVVARFVQPITAAAIPPLAWVTFQATAVRPFLWARDGLHLLVPGFALFCLVFAPQVLDAVIPLAFAGYGLMMLIRLRQGADALPRTRLDAGGVPGLIWTVIAASMLMSALSDVLIVVVQVVGMGAWQAAIVSVTASLNLLVIGALSLSPNLQISAEAEDSPRQPDAQAEEADAQLMSRLDRVVAEQKLYLDPDLTLSRMARRLGVPVKQVSAAINRTTGENVSRYINARRVAAACAALQDGESVTNAMLSAGFNTKSNFNREFLRVTGVSPTAWIARNTADP